MRWLAVLVAAAVVVSAAQLVAVVVLLEDDRFVSALGAAVLGGAVLIAAVITQRSAPSAAPDGEDRRLGEFLNDLPDLVFEIDPRRTITYISDGCEWLLGQSAAEMVGRPLSDFLAEGEPGRLAELLAGIHDDRVDEFRTDLVFLHTDGERRTATAVARAVRGPGRRLEAVRGGLRDISGRVAVEEALRSSEARLRTVLETAQSGILIVQRDGTLSLYNRALCDMLGYSWGEMAQLAVSDLLPADGEGSTAAAVLSQPLWTGEERVQREERLRRRDGTLLAVDLSVSAYREQGQVVGVLVEARDITHRKDAEETIERLAYYDRLTGLPNRTLFDRRLIRATAEAARTQRQVGVLLCDLDQFKIVNDTLGHQLGDRLLIVVAERIAGAVALPHTLARPGGDEFMLLLPDIAAPEVAAGAAERILDALRVPFEVDGHRLHVDASIGISLAPLDGAEPDILLQRADTAMYQAKSHRRNSYRFYAAAQDRQAERLALETGLRRALEQQQFVLHYQPLYDASGEARGVEALLRWAHPERGLVPPAEFIPHLEETGMIGAVGAWVLREACAQMRRWCDGGRTDWYVAVNLSARQFQDESLVDTVAAALRESDLDPAHLVVEVTETAVMHDVDAAIDMLQRLRRIGVATLLDDFGTGHSSLSQLKRLPVRGLKIDRSFVRELERNADDRAIVAAIASLGRALGIAVIAEGVETEEHRRILGAIEVDTFQGYLYSRPLPAEQLAAIAGVGGDALPSARPGAAAA